MRPGPTLPFTGWRLHLRAVDPVRFQTFPGAVLRNGLGEALKEVTCLQGAGCAGRAGDPGAPICGRPLDCLFGYAFESRRPAWATWMPRGSHVPHPFILEPPLRDRRAYEPGEVFSLALGLVGMARPHFWRFAEAFERLGRTGVGARRGRFDLVGVRRTRDVSLAVPTPTPSEDPAEDSRVSVIFLTPAHLQDGNESVERVPFAVLVHRLFGRVRDLLYFHCGQEVEPWSPWVLEQAQMVEAVVHSTRWVHRVQYHSRRQPGRTRLGGLVGSVTYAGPVRPFIPMLRLAEDLHVGKGTAYGFGRVSVVVVRDDEPALTIVPGRDGSGVLPAGGAPPGGPGSE